MSRHSLRDAAKPQPHCRFVSRARTGAPNDRNTPPDAWPEPSPASYSMFVTSVWTASSRVPTVGLPSPLPASAAACAVAAALASP